LKSTDNSPLDGGVVGIGIKGTLVSCAYPLGYSHMANNWLEVKIDLLSNPWPPSNVDNHYNCQQIPAFKDYEIEHISISGFEGDVWIDGLYFSDK
jgi:hypothetical protein